MSTSSEAIRQAGNEHFKKATQTESRELKKTHYTSALTHYREAFAKEASTDDAKKSAKNIAICCKHLLAIENHGVTKRFYFNEAAKYFSIALQNDAKGSEGVESEWSKSCVAYLQELVNAFTDYLSNTRSEEQLAHFNCFVRNLNRHTPFLEEQHVVATCFCSQANMIFNQAAPFIADRNCKDGIRLLNEMHFPLEEAERLNRDSDLHSELNVLRNDYRTYMALSEALQAYDTGLELLNVAIYDEENLEITRVWEAMDKFKEAVVVARGEEVEFECMALERIGYIYYKVLKKNSRGKEYFRKVMELANTLERNKFEFKWYTQAAGCIKEMQDKVTAEEEAKLEARKKPIIEECKEEFQKIKEFSGKDHRDFIDFLFEKHPPIHRSNHATLKTELATFMEDNQWKKVFQKMVTYYHPDRIDEEVYGLRYLIFCEEITKFLSQKYESYKI